MLAVSQTLKMSVKHFILLGIFLLFVLQYVSCSNILAFQYGMDVVNKKTGTSVVLSVKEPQSTSGMSVCGRARFTFLNKRRPFVLFSKAALYFDEYEAEHGMYMVHDAWYLFHWPKQRQTPFAWESFCIVEDRKSFDASISFGKQPPVDVRKNDTFLRQSQINVNTTIQVGGYEEETFVGWVTDLNIWDRALSDEEVKRFLECSDSLPHPTILNWKELRVKSFGSLVRNVSVPIETVCSHQSIGGPIVRVIPIRMKFQSASDSCRKLGGRMFSPIKDKKNLKGIYDMGLKHDTFPTCKTDFWTPFRRSIQNDTLWYNTNDNTEMIESDLPWAFGQPNGKGFQDCSAVNRDKFDVMFDSNCDSFYYCFACELPANVTFNFAGNCSSVMKMDVLYYLDFDALNNGFVELVGFSGKSKIIQELDHVLPVWNLYDVQNNSIFGHYTGDHHLPLGLLTWNVLSSHCTSHTSSEKLMIQTKLKLSKCSKDEFACDNADCVPLQSRCNIVRDCNDFSDENDCQILTLDSNNYQTLFPPTTSRMSKTILLIRLSIHEMDNFNENTMSFRMRFTIEVEWFDQRLIFQNLLTSNVSTNQLSKAVQETIWLPNIIFTNAKEASNLIYDQVKFAFCNNINIKKISFIYCLQFASLGIRLRGDPVPSPVTKVYRERIFNSSENPLLYKRVFDLELRCDFSSTDYPFDTQNCGIELGLPDDLIHYAELQMVNVTYLGRNILSQYEVESIYNISESDNTLNKVGFNFRRLFLLHLTSNYLPTVSLLTMSEITLFFDNDDSDMAMTLSLTITLVMYTMYQSISAIQPKTEYLKLGDVWIIFCLLMPMVVFLLEVAWKLCPGRQTTSVSDHQKNQNHWISISSLRSGSFQSISWWIVVIFIIVFIIAYGVTSGTR